MSCSLEEAGKGLVESMPIYTVGHSNHSPEALFDLVRIFKIKEILDIRSVPYSGRFPYFNKGSLKNLCTGQEIDYQWRGDVLGGMRDDGLGFEEIANSEFFIKAISEIAVQFESGENTVRRCLLCSEKDPSRCHRSSLIGPALMKHGIDLHHIIPDGTLILQSELDHQKISRSSDRAGSLTLFDDD